MIERYEFIDAEKDTMTDRGEPKYTIVKMCEWLDVSTSGFYDWCDRCPSATQQRRDRLKLIIKKAFTDSDETYGHRRVHAQLARWGERCTPELVRELMRELDLLPCQPRPLRGLTEPDPAAGPIPDLLGPDFTAECPGQKMIGDITYIPTWEGWGYLSTVIDCHTKAVIGWAMDDNYKTPLIEEAMHMAAANNHITPDAVFRSARGSNYTSESFARTLKNLGITQSVGRTGICFDNAMAESFFSTLKNELVHRTAYPTRKKAIDDIAPYIELRYNRKRLHSGLGYRTPHEVHTEYLNRDQAA